MAIRLAIFLLLVLAMALFPWGVTLAAFLAVFIFVPNFYEGLLLTVTYDILFGPAFSGVAFSVTIVALLLVWMIPRLKQRLAISR